MAWDNKSEEHNTVAQWEEKKSDYEMRWSN